MYVCVLEGGYKSKFWKFLCTYEVDDAQKLNKLIIIENLSLQQVNPVQTKSEIFLC